MKTYVDSNSLKENAIYKSKERPKDNENNENKYDEAPKINNIEINNDENDEKNKEDKNINNNDNNNIITIKKESFDNKEKIIKQNNIKDMIKNKIEEEKNEEDPLITYISSGRKISEEVIKNSTKLILEEISGDLLQGKSIKINAGGMIEGRNKRDGFTIFGQKKCENSKNSNSHISVKKDEEIKIDNTNNNNINNNDIFIPDYELNYTKNLGCPYIFSIYYKLEDKSYYIRSYSGKGSDNKILFIKLSHENKYILKQRELISAGNIIFQVTPLENNCLEIINLTNKKLNNYKRVFDGAYKKIITIGRHKECDFFFVKDKSFSRYQTTFEFDDNNKEWNVIDGKDNKGSTNGTWIFGTHSFLIKNKMIVEILNSKILIKEITDENIQDNK